MKYKLIAMDFDGTLLTSEKKVSNNNKRVLSGFKNNGYIIVGVTARNMLSVKSVCDINMFDYLILNNGSYIYDVKKDSGKYIGFIDNNTISSITNYFKDKVIGIDYCALNKYFKYKTPIKFPTDFIKKINNIDEIDEKILKINIFIDEDIDKYKEYIYNNYSDINSFIMQDSDDVNDEKWIVLNPKNIDKSSSLKILCDKLNITMNEVIFFGDGPNDIQIIHKVGMGVAMANALDEVKNAAKEVTLSNNEDGIAYFLEKMK